MTVPNEHLMILAALLFCIGLSGFFIRRNVIIVLLSIELMLNAANLTFIAGSRAHSTALANGGGSELTGEVFAIFVILVAAVEAAVGLALVIALFRKKQSVSLEALTELGD